jgi:Uma2 family endonuclease
MDTSYATPSGNPSAPGDLTWEVANLFPAQGNWTEEEFLELPSPHRFELSDGHLATLPMATWVHLLIGKFLLRAIWAYLDDNDVGHAGPAPLFVRLWDKQIRQPDIVFCFHEHIHDRTKVQNGADVVFEIVSPGEENRDRDLVKKRKLYAKAGIREYWIVDAELATISVLSLDGDVYRVAAEYKAGDQAASMLLPGFSVDVSATFAAANK